MKKISFLLLLQWLTLVINAQVNLVPNPSFDLNNACPTGPSQWPKCNFWNNINGFTSQATSPCLNSFATPDYFHSCATPGFAPGTSISHNLNTHSGAGMTRLACYNHNYANYREYLTAQLNCNMIPGITYSVSFYSATGSTTNTVSHVGIALSNAVLTQTCHEVATNASTIIQTNNNTTISNTWTAIGFTINPTTTLNRVTIGSFNSDATNNVADVSNYAWYYFDDISIIPISSFSLTSNVHHAGCGSTGSATVTPSNPNLTYSYTWSPGGYNTSSVQNLPPGTYTVISSASDGGCNTFTASTIISNNTFPLISLNVSNYTFCTNATTSIPISASTSFSNGPISFTWMPNNLYTQTINVSPNILTTYTISATSPSGCANSATLAVSVVTNCCTNSTVGLIPLTSMNTFYSNNSYFVSTNITLGANTTFQDAEVLMMPNVKIIVPSGLVLDLDHAHLYACGVNMWQGIEVQNGGQIITSNVQKGSNLIEDAEVAIDLSNISTGLASPPIQIDNTIFNKNFIGINIENGASISHLPLKISECVFTSRDISFSTMVPFIFCYGACWPQADFNVGGLRTPINMAALQGLTPPYNLQNFSSSSSLKLPHLSDPISNIGIRIRKIGTNFGSAVNTGVDIGATYSNLGNNYNIFDNLVYGIDIEDASLITENNVFQNIRPLNLSNPASGGVAINHKINTLLNAKLSLSPSSGLTSDGNKFWNCWKGIVAQNVYYYEIEKSIFRSDRNVYTGSGPGMIGITAKTNRFTFNLKNNEFNNIDDCISISLNTGNHKMNNGPLINGTYAGTLEINQNYFGPEITSSTPILPNTEYCNFPITIEGVTSSNWKYAGAGSIQSNKIDRSYKGIKIEALSAYSLEIGGNDIRLTDDNVVQPGTLQYGIYAKNSTDNLIINQNTVRGYTLPSSPFVWNQNIKCFLSENNQSISHNQSPIITCNQAYDAYIGFEFNGSQPNTSWLGNTMFQKMYKGLSLTNNGEIGIQGNPTTSCGDIWDDNLNAPPFTWQSSTPPNMETYVDGTSNAWPGSFLFGMSPMNTPINNGTGGGIPFLNGAFGAPMASIDNALTSYFCVSVSYPTSPSQKSANATNIDLNENVKYGIKLFPNPSNGLINIISPLIEELLKVRIFDSSGKLIISFDATTKNNNVQLELPTTELIYLVEITNSKNEVFKNKIVIIK